MIPVVHFPGTHMNVSDRLHICPVIDLFCIFYSLSVSANNSSVPSAFCFRSLSIDFPSFRSHWTLTCEVRSTLGILLVFLLPYVLGVVSGLFFLCVSSLSFLWHVATNDISPLCPSLSCLKVVWAICFPRLGIAFSPISLLVGPLFLRLPMLFRSLSFLHFYTICPVFGPIL